MGQVILAGTSSNGKLLKSTDDGQTWSDLGQPGSTGQTSIYSLETLDNGVVLAGTHPNAKILRSTDGGTNWTDLGSPGGRNFLNSITDLGSGIVLATAVGNAGGANLLRSTDYGATWSDLGSQGAGYLFDVIDVGSGIALLCQGGSPIIKRSPDYGQTWTNVKTLTGAISARSLGYLGNGVALCGTNSNGAIWRSTDYGATWSNLGTQFAQSYMYGFCTVSNSIGLVGTAGSGLILRSTNSGASWSNLGTQYSQTAIYDIVLLASGTLLAGTTPGGRILRSVDDGLTWSDIGQQFSENTIYALTAVLVDGFTVSLQYKQAGGAFANVTGSLGDVGADMGTGSKTCYWDDPSQDRNNVEISDAQVQLTLVPDGENSETHTANITSVTQLTTGDGTGAQGDVKVEYEIT